MGLSAIALAASAGGGEELERFIDAVLAAARAAALSELMVLSHPEAFEAALAEVGDRQIDPRLVFMIKRMIVSHELVLSVLMSARHEAGAGERAASTSL